MDDRQIALIQKSYSTIAPISNLAAELLFAHFFTGAPHLAARFAETDMKAQGARLMSMLGEAVRDLGKTVTVTTAAAELALEYRAHGMQPSDYDALGRALMQTLQTSLGDSFTGETRAAWGVAFAQLSEGMQAIADPVGAKPAERASA